MNGALRSLALPALLAALTLQVLGFIRTASPTVDEYAHHLPSGASYLVTGDFRMNPASPPLARMWPAIPAALMGAAIPTEHPSWRTNDSPAFAREFFTVKNPGKTESFFFWARVMVLLVSLAFAAALYAWTRGWAGEGAAVASVFLFVFSPNILAHSGLATADLAVSFFFFLSLVSFAGHLRAPTAASAARTGVLTAAALLSKFSAVLLLPCFPLVAFFGGRRKCLKAGHTALFMAALLVTVWAGYFFETKPLLENTPDPPKKIAFLHRLGGDGLVRAASEIPLPMATFISGLAGMIFTRASGTDAFLLGEWSRQGWWYYYIVALAVKETLPLLALGVCALLALKRLGADRLTRAVIYVPIALFFILTVRDKAQAGIRYFLPLFPLLLAAAGFLAARVWGTRNTALRVLLAAAFAWHAASAASVAPHYLAYFNETIGGPANGHKILRDSNLDWGQDWKEFGAFAARQNYPEVVMLTHTIQDPSEYGIPYRWPEAGEYERPRPTVYALGAHRIDVMKWRDRFKPAAVIGHSIFVYDLRGAALER